MNTTDWTCTKHCRRFAAVGDCEHRDAPACGWCDAPIAVGAADEIGYCSEAHRRLDGYVVGAEGNI